MFLIVFSIIMFYSEDKLLPLYHLTHDNLTRRKLVSVTDVTDAVITICMYIVSWSRFYESSQQRYANVATVT